MSAFFIYMLFISLILLNIFNGAILGKLIDAETKQPVSWATILIDDLKKQTTSHEDGTFQFNHIPAGNYVISVIRMGYESRHFSVSVIDGVNKPVTIELKPSVMRMKEVEISAAHYHQEESRPAEKVITGKELRLQLGRTLAETLMDEPGLSQVSMGPAPARPVLRGLSGDRLMILEDGNKTGDMSTTSPDHALAIDPINSERIEILRGPAAMLYSSNALGGVVNVIKGNFPTEKSDHIHGNAGFQGESVNTGASGNVTVSGSGENVTYKTELSGRIASNISTPEGTLDNTAINTFSGSVGVGFPKKWGVWGFSGNIFSTGYGIPGDFVGAHPNGVKIDMYRRQAVARFDVIKPTRLFRRIDGDAAYSYYYHQEREFDENTQSHSLVGAEYIVHTLNTNLRFHHNPFSDGHRGTLAIWTEFRDFTAGGFSFTPPTREYSAALINFHEFETNRWNFQVAGRLDARITHPLEQRVSRLIGEIESRQFLDYSGSARLKRNITNHFSGGVLLLKTTRIPAIEELFSEGPHLPAYSFEIGNPQLGIERGFGGEFFLHFDQDRFHLKLAAFRNSISDYMYPLFTGRESDRRPMPLYQTIGADAIMLGFESNLEWLITKSLVANTTLSYVQADLVDENRPLPFIPPLNGKFNFEYRGSKGSIGVALRGAAAQNRLGEFEEPTDGFLISDIFSQWNINTESIVHTFTFSIENLTNETYRMHLSRVKSIMPEPGRNVKILYRVYF